MIYADYNATTPPLPTVVEAMTAVLRDGWGNPGAKQHTYGRRALAQLDQARAEVAALINARPDEIIFTSGATEACNLAILGLGERLLASRPRMVTCATEHSAISEPLRRLAEAGADLTVLPVDAQGRLSGQAVESALDDRTGLLALMLANNETGVIHDVAAASAMARRHGILVVCDATQVVGKLPVDVTILGADALACTGHKMYGPQGCGALWIRRGLGLSAQLHGGSQERGLRPGTHNLPGIVGFAAACTAARTGLRARTTHLRVLSNQLEGLLRQALPGIVIHGADAARIPGTSMLTLPGLQSGWLGTLAEVAASNGSACTTGEGSHVLRAMGCTAADAANSIRISLGMPSTSDEVEHIAAALARGAHALRGTR